MTHLAYLVVQPRVHDLQGVCVVFQDPAGSRALHRFVCPTLGSHQTWDMSEVVIMADCRRLPVGQNIFALDILADGRFALVRLHSQGYNVGYHF